MSTKLDWLDGLIKLANPNTKDKNLLRVDISLEDLWRELAKTAGLGETTFRDPLDACEKVKNHLLQSTGSVKKHSKVDVQGIFKKRISQVNCSEIDKQNVWDKIDSAKTVPEKFSKAVKEASQDCRKACNKDKNCEKTCTQLENNLTTIINETYFLLDTCYNAERAKNLYNRLDRLTSSHRKASLIIAGLLAYMVLRGGLGGSQWLYELAREKLGLPFYPWLGDAAAFLYIVEELAKKNKTDRKAGIGVKDVIDLARVLLVD